MLLNLKQLDKVVGYLRSTLKMALHELGRMTRCLIILSLFWEDAGGPNMIAIGR